MTPNVQSCPNIPDCPNQWQLGPWSQCQCTNRATCSCTGEQKRQVGSGVPLLQEVLNFQKFRWVVHQLEHVQQWTNHQKAKLVKHHHVPTNQLNAAIRYLSYVPSKKDRIVIFRRFSVMYQPLENIVTQISFEVYAVRVAPKCKSKFIICSLDLSRQKWQNIDVTSLVIRIKIELNSFEKLKNREKGKTRHNLIIKGDGIKMLNSLAPPLQRAYSSLAALDSSISKYHHPFIRNILRHKYTLVILITIDES